MSKLTDKIIKKFDSDDTLKFSDIDPFKDVKTWVSTGSPSLDLFLGTYGYPSGIIELRGESKSGKTTLSLEAMKWAINNISNPICCVLTVERRDNKPYAQRMGLNTDDVIVHKIRNVEMMWNRVKQTIELGKKMAEEEKIENPKFIFVLDSLGALTSRQEISKKQENSDKDEEKDAAMASTARAFKSGLRWLVSEIYDNDITFFVINHTYDNIGGMGGKKSYGGNGIQYMPTMRFETEKSFAGGDIKTGEEIVGQLTNIKVIKSDFGQNGKKFPIEIALGIGIVLHQNDIDLAIEHNLLKKSGYGAVGFAGKLKWNNRKELYELYRQRNPFLKILIKQITKISHGIVLEIRNKEDKLYKNAK